MIPFTHHHRPKHHSSRWLTLVSLVLFTLLLSLVAASEPASPRLFARQQQNPRTPSTNPPAPNTGGNGGGTPPPSSSASSQPTSSAPAPGGGTLPPRPTALPPLGSPGSGTIIGGPGIPVGPNSIIDPRRPVSRLSMIQPKQNAVNPPLFAVGSTIDFEWVFDNTTLVFPPANLTIEVSLTSNPKIVWPVANITGTATSIAWNTGAVSPSLYMGFYTLSIYDTKLGKQGVATSGHLMPYSDLQFGMYIPEPYVPRAGAYCEKCPGGMSTKNGTPVRTSTGVFHSAIMVLSSIIAIWGLAL
ncbi:hypothetical protein BGW39_003585 [Mortierella sp. 14UC]|nr:hypothetical protein BGW39_003585 [Mortierella sp. 14UC]